MKTFKKIGKWILIILFWPFVIGYLLAKLIVEKSQSRALKYSGVGIVAVLTLFVGIFWTSLFFAPFAGESDTQEIQQEKPQVKGEETVKETKTETKEEIIPFETKTVDDNTLKKGETKVKQEGKDGKKEVIYRVIYEDGSEVSREIIDEIILEEPVDKIILNGTKQEPVSTQPAPSPQAKSNSGFTCAGKTKCSEMTTCAEAKFYLNTCGVDRLDNNNDGIPCENICQ